MFAPAVYVLCFLTSAICSVLLVRSYLRSRTRLLMWSAACFILLALNNLLLVVDLLVLPAAVDLAVLRSLSSLAAVTTLLYGFISETE